MRMQLVNTIHYPNQNKQVINDTIAVRIGIELEYDIDKDKCSYSEVLES